MSAKCRRDSGARDRAGQFNWPLSSDHVLVVVWRHFRGVPRDVARLIRRDGVLTNTCSRQACLKSLVVTILAQLARFIILQKFHDYCDELISLAIRRFHSYYSSITNMWQRRI